MLKKELIIKSIEINIKQLQDNYNTTQDPNIRFLIQKAITRKQAAMFLIQKGFDPTG